MGEATAVAFAATCAATLGTLLALVVSGLWRFAYALCLLLAVSFVCDVSMLAAPDAFWSPQYFVLREITTATLLGVYALEIALGFPRRAKRLALYSGLVVTVITLAIIACAGSDVPRAAYRGVGVLNMGAAGAMSAAILAGLLFEVRPSAVPAAAGLALAVAYFAQGLALAQFEVRLDIARVAQFAATTIYVGASLVTCRAALQEAHE